MELTEDSNLCSFVISFLVLQKFIATFDRKKRERKRQRSRHKPRRREKGRREGEEGKKRKRRKEREGEKGGRGLAERSHCLPLRISALSPRLK